MKHLLFAVFIAVVLVGCGGGKDKNKESSPSVLPSSVASSAPVSSSVSSSSSSSSKSSSISSSLSSLASSSAASSQASSAASSIPFTLSSNSFISGEKIPVKYACYGTEISPHLQWDITSPEIKSFALIIEDYDAIALVGYPYVHWNVFNIPADTRQIAEGATLRAMPAGSVEGVNDDGLRKYSGPCPPEGTGTHHYFFALYALNKADLGVNANRSVKRSEFEKQYASAIIQKVEVTGTYFYK
jgi:Raf kinase inhibitor-like YbhB/YbcL family protein